MRDTNFCFGLRFVAAITLLAITACASSTTIQSVPQGARLYLNGEPVGATPYVMTDTKIVGSSTMVRLELPGYETVNGVISRNEEFDAGACIGGVFLLFPFLWIQGYKPFHTFELHPLGTGYAPPPGYAPFPGYGQPPGSPPPRIPAFAFWGIPSAGPTCWSGHATRGGQVVIAAQRWDRRTIVAGFIQVTSTTVASLAPFILWAAVFLATGCVARYPAQVVGSLEARYATSSDTGSGTATVAIGVYRNLLTRSLYSRCRMFPSDSQLFERRARKCGTMTAAVLGISRLYLETEASTEVLPVTFADHRVRWFDNGNPSTCTSGP